jgi:outer membrane protein TolC
MVTFMSGDQSVGQLVPARKLRCLQAFFIVPTLLLLAPSLAWGATGERPAQIEMLPGATVESVLSVAQQLSPDLVARALDADAAQSRIEIASALPDPTIRITDDEMPRTNGPRRTMLIYGIEQKIPLWGKRDLRGAIARAEADRFSAQIHASNAELTERVKVAFAAYYYATHALAISQELLKSNRRILATRQGQYVQNRGSQSDALRAEIDGSRIEATILKLTSQVNAARGSLNALLLRSLDAPLAEPKSLPIIPAQETLDAGRLAARALMSNPKLRADLADIRGAEAQQELAQKSWYPDITLGVSAIDRRSNGPTGYVASVGIDVPLQWGLHEATSREATATLGAERADRGARQVELRQAISETAGALESSNQTRILYAEKLLPQSRALLRSSMAAYAAGKMDMETALEAEQNLFQVQIEFLSAEFETQRQLAAIERLVGEKL